MTSKHEIILQALEALLGSHDALVMRENELPVACPEQGILNIAVADPEEEGVHLGTGRREYERKIELEIIVQSHAATVRNTRLDAALVQAAGLLTGVTLDGLLSYLHIAPPQDADDIPMEGAASLKGAVLPITLFYETSHNPMETLP